MKCMHAWRRIKKRETVESYFPRASCPEIAAYSIMSDRLKDRQTTLILAAETLKEFTLLRDVANGNQQCPRRASKEAHQKAEAHPKAVLSTKQKQDDSTAPRGCSSPCDATPVNNSAKTLCAQPQVVPSPRCRVSRQPSTPVDLPPAAAKLDTAQPDDACAITDPKKSPSRPGTLGLRRDPSINSSSSSEIPTPSCSPCLPIPSPEAGRQLVSSYPPGPTASRPHQVVCGEEYLVRVHACRHSLIHM